MKKNYFRSIIYFCLFILIILNVPTTFVVAICGYTITAAILSVIQILLITILVVMRIINTVELQSNNIETSRQYKVIVTNIMAIKDYYVPSEGVCRQDYIDDKDVRMLIECGLLFFIKDSIEFLKTGTRELPQLEEQLDLLNTRIGLIDKALRVFELIPIKDDVLNMAIEEHTSVIMILIRYREGLRDLITNTTLLKDSLNKMTILTKISKQ